MKLEVKFRKKYALYIAVACIFIDATSLGNPFADLFMIRNGLKLSDVLVCILAIYLLYTNFNEGIRDFNLKSRPEIALLLILMAYTLIQTVLYSITFEDRNILHLSKMLFIGLSISTLPLARLSKEDCLIIMKAGLYGVVATCYLCLLIASFQSLNFTYVKYLKIGSDLGANPVSFYAVIFFPVAVHLAVKNDSLFESLFCFIALASYVVHAESKAAWIVMPISVFLYRIFVARIPMRVYAVFLAGLLLILFDSATKNQIVDEFLYSGHNVSERIEFVNSARNVIDTYWATGVGLANYVHTDPLNSDSPHNGYLLVLAERGFLGLSFFLLVCFASAYMSYIRNDLISRLVLVCLIVISMLSTFTGIFTTQLILFFLIGLSCSQLKR